MSQSLINNSADNPGDNPDDLVCPECGYDLRQLSSDRCPECGTPFDRTTATRSQIPWANRRTIGFVRGYCRTAWLAAVRPDRLATEFARPVKLRDAQQFRFITVLIASLIPLILVVGLLLKRGGTAQAYAGFPRPSNSSPLGLPPALDLTLPWAAGALLWPIVPIAIFLFVYLASGVASYWFHPAGSPLLRQNRAVALSHYACAPLAFTPLLLLALFVVINDYKAINSSLPDALQLVCVGAILGIWFLMWVNTLRLLRRVADASSGRMFGAAVGVPIAWMLCAVIAFGLMPWLVGYVFLMIDSMRA